MERKNICLSTTRNPRLHNFRYYGIQAVRPVFPVFYATVVLLQIEFIITPLSCISFAQDDRIT